MRQEAAADALAARRLVALPELLRAALWVESFAELAHEIDVDEHMLRVRFRNLHPSERGYLRDGLAVKTLSA